MSCIEQYEECDYRCDWTEERVSDFWDNKIQYNQKEVWKNSCTVHWSMWAISDLLDYTFTIEERKEIRGDRTKWQRINKMVKHVCNYRNEKKDIKLQYKYVAIGSNEMYDIISKWYSIITWYAWNGWYNKDKNDDCILQKWEFWDDVTYKHCIRITKKWEFIHVVDNYKGIKCNVYRLIDFKELVNNAVFFKWWYFFTYINEPKMYNNLPLHITTEWLTAEQVDVWKAWRQEWDKFIENWWELKYSIYLWDDKVTIITKMLIDLSCMR